MMGYRHLLMHISSLPVKGLENKLIGFIEDSGARISMLRVIDPTDKRNVGVDKRVIAAKEQLANLGQKLMIPQFDQHIRIGKLEAMIVEIAQDLAVDGLLLSLPKLMIESELGAVKQIVQQPLFDTMIVFY